MTSRRCLSTLVCALLVGLALVPAGAQASKVSITLSSGPDPQEYIQYSASKREANRLSVKESHRTYTFTDSGAKSIRAKGGCRARGRHKAVCKSGLIQNVTVNLGDRNDTVRFSGFGGSGEPTAPPTDPTQVANIGPDLTGGEFAEAIDVSGGAGNDVIRTSNAIDFVDPGPGADTVSTLGADDDVSLLPDGVTDTVNGGPGIDGVSYCCNPAPAVTVNAATGTGGAAGETDRLAQFEDWTGGVGDDTLIGSDNTDGLFGAAGADKIDGAGGNDYLAAGASYDPPEADQVTGGPGDDILDGRELYSASNPTVTDQIQRFSCGDGTDRAFGTPNMALDASCELTIYVPYLFSDSATPFSTTFPVRPVSTTGGNPQFLIACPAAPPNADPALFVCTGQVDVEAATMPGQSPPAPSFGAGAFSIQAGQQSVVTVPLSAAGQQALAAHAVLGVHVRSTAALTSAGGGDDFGWQTQLG